MIGARALAGRVLATCVLAACVLAALSLLPSHALAQASAAGCPPAPTPPDAERLQAGVRNAQDHGFLWRIARDGRTSHLYGTIHAARIEWMFPGPRTATALAGSDILALELDPLDSDVRARLMAELRARGAVRLPLALAVRLDRRLIAECLDPNVWRTFAPEFQVASLGAMAARREGLDPSYAVDAVLALIARGLGKPLASLETPEAQIAALTMPTRAETIEFVASGLDELDSGRSAALLARVTKSWRDSDLADLEGYERWCDCLRTAAERASMKRLLDDRNPKLADAIDALHTSGSSVFAAVGSLHMVGPTGLPALLRARGYTVEALPFER